MLHVLSVAGVFIAAAYAGMVAGGLTAARAIRRWPGPDAGRVADVVRSAAWTPWVAPRALLQGRR